MSVGPTAAAGGSVVDARTEGRKARKYIRMNRLIRQEQKPQRLIYPQKWKFTRLKTDGVIECTN